MCQFLDLPDDVITLLSFNVEVRDLLSLFFVNHHLNKLINNNWINNLEKRLGEDIVKEINNNKDIGPINTKFVINHLNYFDNKDMRLWKQYTSSFSEVYHFLGSNYTHGNLPEESEYPYNTLSVTFCLATECDDPVIAIFYDCETKLFEDEFLGVKCLAYEEEIRNVFYREEEVQYNLEEIRPIIKKILLTYLLQSIEGIYLGDDRTIRNFKRTNEELVLEDKLRGRNSSILSTQ
jgi:hypothetical protein